MSTIWLTNIVCELNTVFQKIKTFCIQEMSILGDKYDEYYCYQFVREMALEEYNRKYNRMPWEYIIINEEFDELCEEINKK